MVHHTYPEATYPRYEGGPPPRGAYLDDDPFSLRELRKLGPLIWATGVVVLALLMMKGGAHLVHWASDVRDIKEGAASAQESLRAAREAFEEATRQLKERADPPESGNDPDSRFIFPDKDGDLMISPNKAGTIAYLSDIGPSVCECSRTQQRRERRRRRYPW